MQNREEIQSPQTLNQEVLSNKANKSSLVDEQEEKSMNYLDVTF